MPTLKRPSAKPTKKPTTASKGKPPERSRSAVPVGKKAKTPTARPATPASSTSLGSPASPIPASPGTPAGPVGPVRSASPANPVLPAEPTAPKAALHPRLSELFRLSAEEGRIVDALQHVGARTAAELATELSLPLPQLLSLLAPEGVLRGRALVELPDSASLGWGIPSDVLQIGRGMSCTAGTGRPDVATDEKTLFLASLPGVSYLPAPPADGAWAQDLIGLATGDRPTEKAPQNIVDLVREHLVAAHPVLLSLGGASADQVTALSHVVRQRLQRPVVVVDGPALAGWPLPLLAQALRRLRRDTDLRGAVLIVHEPRALSSAWRAVLLPRPTGQTAPLIVVNEGPAQPMGALPAAPRGEPGWTVVSVALRSQMLPAASPHVNAIASAAPTSGAEVGDEHEDPAVAASRQEARRQAAIDAARAMGRPVPKELMVATPAATAKATAQPAASAAPSAVASPRPSPAVEVAAAPAPAAAIKAAPSSPAPASAPAPAAEGAPRRPANPRLAAALAAAGLPPPGSDDHIDPEYARRRAARLQAAAAAASSAPTAPPATVAAAVPDVPAVAAVSAVSAGGGATTSGASTAAAVTGVEAPAASGLPNAAAVVEEDGPPLPLEADVSLDELIKVARTTPNTVQRIEVLRRLTGSRHSAIIQLFRHFVGSPIAAVREAAEQGMSSIFGPHWNRSRAIAPPVQPPRSEDGGRGPGGAF